MKEKTMFKGILKRVLAAFDYELRKRSRYFIDDFQDQKKLLQQQDVKYILDCGANIGQTAVKYKQLFPSANIYSFEPTSETFLTLCETFKDCERVKPQQLAVSNLTGYKHFFVYEDSQLNSLWTVDSQTEDRYMLSMTNVKSIDVPTITIDEFCTREKIERIDLLKMDIQGGELLALQGAVELLERQAIDLIYTEVFFAKLYDNQAKFDEINKFLDDYGYSLYGIYNMTRLLDGTLGYADAIFITHNIQKKLPSPYAN